MQSYLTLFAFLVSLVLAGVFYFLAATAIYVRGIGVNGSFTPTFTWRETPFKFGFAILVYLFVGSCFLFFTLVFLKKLIE